MTLEGLGKIYAVGAGCPGLAKVCKRLNHLSIINHL